MLDKDKLLSFICKNSPTVDSDSFSSSFPQGVRCAFRLIIKGLENGDFDIPPKPQETCHREYYPPNSTDQNLVNGFYKTTCGVKYSETDIMIEKEYDYCPYCSKPIEDVDDE